MAGEPRVVEGASRDDARRRVVGEASTAEESKEEAAASASAPRPAKLRDVDEESSCGPQSDVPAKPPPAVGASVLELRTRVIGAMLHARHRSDAAALARAYHDERLAAYLRDDLQRIGVLDAGPRVDVELGAQYETHILPLLQGKVPPRAPSLHERPKPATLSRSRRLFFWLFGGCMN
mmetsp:Transcript_246/g.952  ORF Transcript_246/g.952 Transcript_246/m.952 type:complete len:178 (-) Transcript_246:328-861(-)